MLDGVQTKGTLADTDIMPCGTALALLLLMVGLGLHVCVSCKPRAIRLTSALHTFTCMRLRCDGALVLFALACNGPRNDRALCLLTACASNCARLTTESIHGPHNASSQCSAQLSSAQPPQPTNSTNSTGLFKLVSASAVWAMSSTCQRQ